MKSRPSRTQRVVFAAAAVGIGCIVAMPLVASPVSAATTPKAAKNANVAVKAPTTFPTLKVLDLATGKTIDLASFNVSTKPQLVWFWAPT